MGAVEALVAGSVLVILPMVLRDSPVSRALQEVQPFGFVLLAFGAVVLWWRTRRAKPSPSASTATTAAPRPGRAAGVVSAAKRVAPKRDLVAEYALPPAAPSTSAPAQPSRWSAEVFARIEWRRFEAVMEKLFGLAGFETRSQSHGADGGVDVWLYGRSDSTKPVGVVQCKHWIGRRVGVDKVRELKGVMASHGLRRGQFATTSRFTPDAVDFASQNGIHLLDVDGILKLIAARPGEDQRALLAAATEGEYWRPTCVNCGIKLVERTPRGGGKPFWGCSNYPRCRTRMEVRNAREADAVA